MSKIMRTEVQSVVVRIAEAHDLPVCLSFEEKDEFGRRTKLDEQIVGSNIASGAVFLAEYDGCAVGYASLNFLYASRLPLLSWWYVEDEFRNRGVGSMLLRKIEQTLSTLGFDNLLISACRELEIERHRSAGLEEIGSLKLGPNELEYFFSKPLTSSHDGS
jgi:GNAT superfamily N-acetyltransferase